MKILVFLCSFPWTCKCDAVCDIEELVLLLSFGPSEVFPAYTLGYHRKDNNNNLILEAQRH